MRFRNLLFSVMALLGASSTALADLQQQFYDDGYQLLTEFRKCSTIPQQLSLENHNCLLRSEKLIQSKLKSFEFTHRVKIAEYSSNFNNLSDASGFVTAQKIKCMELYPDPLRKVFQNQIKSCQVQVDLNRYFYVVNTFFDY